MSSEQVERWRAMGEKAKGEYDRMAGFPGSGYVSRLGKEIVKMADALEAQRKENEMLRRIGDNLVGYGKGMHTDADMGRDYSVNDVRATGSWVKRTGERILAASKNRTLQVTDTSGYQEPAKPKNDVWDPHPESHHEWKWSEATGTFICIATFNCAFELTPEAAAGLMNKQSRRIWGLMQTPPKMRELDSD